MDLDMEKLESYLAVYFLYFLLAVFALWGLLSAAGAVGYMMDNWIPYFPEHISERMGNALFNTWLPESLGRSLDLSSAYYLRGILFVLSSLGLNGEVISKGFLLFIMALSGFSIFILSRFLKLSLLPSFLCGAFYMFTPFFFNFAIAGGYGALLFYALLPFLLYLLFKLTDSSTPHSFKIFFAFSFLLFLISDFIAYYICFIIVFLLLFLFEFSLSRGIKTLFAFLKCFVLIVASFVGAQLAWLLQLLSDPSSALSMGISIHTGALITTSRFVEFSPGLIKALGLRGLCGNICDYFTWFVVDSSLGLFWLIVSLLLVAIAVLSILLEPRNKRVIYFSCLFLIALFLAKGAQPPAESINVLFFQNSILGKVFRDPYNFMPLLSLSLSLLLGISMNSLMQLPTRLREHQFASIKPLSKMKNFNKKRRFLVGSCLSIIVLSYGLPYFSQILTNNLQTYSLDQNYYHLYRDFLNNQEDYKVLMLPFVEPIVPPQGKVGGGDPLLGSFGKPTLYHNIPGVDDAAKLARFLANSIYSPTAPQINNLGNLLGLMNVKQIVLRKDFSSLYAPYSSNQVALDKLNNQTNIVFSKGYGDNILLYENTNFLDHIFAAQTATLAVTDLSYLLNFPSDKAVFFSDQQSSDSISPLIVNKISIQDENYLDYVQLFLPERYKINPELYVQTHLKDEGWIDLDVNSPPTDWYQSASVRDGVMATVPDTLTIPIEISNSEEYQVWTKVYLNPDLPQEPDLINPTVKSGFVPLNDKSWAMPFIPSVDSLSRLSICLMKWGTPAEDLTGEIKADNGNTPENGASIATFIVPKEQVPDYGVWFDIDLNVQVAPGEKYWIVLNKAGLDANNTYGWAWDHEALGVTAYSDNGNKWEIRNAGSFGYYTYWTKKLTLDIFVDSQKLKELSTNNTDTNRFTWINTEPVMLPEGKHYLKLVSNGGTIIVSNVLVAPKSELVEAGQKAETYAEGKNTCFFFSLDKFGEPSETTSTPGSLSFTKSGFTPNGETSIINITKSFEVWVPFDNEYQFSVEALSNSGDPNLIVYYDNSSLEIKLTSARDIFNTHIAQEKVHLTQGLHKLRLAIDVPNNGCQVILRSFMVDFGKPSTNTSPPDIQFEKIDPTKYIVHIRSTTPFFLIFSEKFDPRWVASSGNVTFKHFKVNFFANGFWVDKTGDFSVTIDFATQELYSIGLTVSFSVFILLVIFSLVPYRFFRKIIQKALK